MADMGRLRRVALLAGVGLAIAVAFSTVRRVPEDSIGVSPSRSVGPGWSLQAPWNRLRIVSVRGRVEASDISVRTREGSSLRFAFTADYLLKPELDPSFRGALWRWGLDAAATNLARGALAEAAAKLPVDDILSDPSRLETAVRQAFLAAGVLTDRLSLTSNLADFVHVRRRTEAAHRLARPPIGRLLLVGWDGADWNVIGPLLDAGRLPNLARLVREGAYGRLRSVDPMFSPLLWTTVATGKTPSQHGVADFLVKDPVTGGRRPITSDFRKVKALWNILPEFGIPSGWIAWWASYPAEPTQGAIVTNVVAAAVVRSGPGSVAGRPDLAYPTAFLASRLGLLVGPEHLGWEEAARLFPLGRSEFEEARARAPVEAPDRDSKRPPDPVVFVIKLLCAMRTYHNLALDMIRQGFPVIGVYYEGVDMMGHRFQHYMAPKMAMVTQEEFERFRGAVEAYYELQDEMLGELLAAAPRNTITILLSDHGFATGADRPEDVPPYTSGQPAEWHRPWGVLVMHGPGIQPGPLAPASLYDIAPTVLYLLGLPLAEDMPGRLLAEAVRPSLLEARPPARIPTYEVVGQPLDRREPAQLDSEAMAEMVANLRALGYVGGEAEPGPTADAAASTERATGEAETQVFYHRNLATHHIKQGNLAEAEAELLAANAKRPMPKTYAMLSEVRASQGRFLDAAAALEDGLEALPDQMAPDSLLWLVEMYLRAGRPEDAARVADRWPSRATPAVKSAIEGRLAEQRGDLPSAAALYESALARDPLLVAIAFRLLEVYRRQGRAEAIEPFLRRGLQRSSQLDAYHHLLGTLAKERGDYAAALGHFRRAVEIVPDDAIYLGDLAVAAAALGRRKEAEEAVAWALRQSPKQAKAWILLGSALDRLGEPARALEAFQKARDLGAEGPAADIAAALVLARTGRMREAKEILAEAGERYPGNAALEAVSRRLSSLRKAAGPTDRGSRIP